MELSPDPLMVEEVWRFISPRKAPPELATCVQAGRKHCLAMVFNTQPPNKLHLALRNECSELVRFRLQDSAVLGGPLERGFNPDQLRAWQNPHFISRSKSGGRAAPSAQAVMVALRLRRPKPPL